MLRRSKPRRVVFTPSMPHLDTFLSRRVSPDHPLRHHPLWLTESDLSNISRSGFEITYEHDNKDKGAIKSPPMLVAQVPYSCLFYNMDQLVPESEVHWQLPLATAPMSVCTMRMFASHTQKELELIRKVRGFESNWWGTRNQWLARGCQVLPNAVPFVTLYFRMTRILHISMLSNAQYLLEHSFVSGKTSTMMFLKDANDTSSNNRNFATLVSTHYKTHGFQSPLYFSKSILSTVGIAVRPDAVPLDLSSLSNEHYQDDRSTALVQDNAKVYQQYYHLSQVMLPENYRIPLNVLEAECANPGVPVHGVTGQVLTMPELQYEAIVNSSPELSSIISCEYNSDRVCSFTDLESPHTIHGRSLWYLPHNVLELGGLIDVNSVPVEVSVPGEKETKKWRMLYNVEQLLLPLEGYKAVGRIAHMGQRAVCQSSLSSENNTAAVTDAGDYEWSL